MPLTLRTDTPAGLAPLAWLLGRWEGVGVLAAPRGSADGEADGPSEADGATGVRFGQVVEFAHDGRDFLSYTASSWALDSNGAMGEPLDVESGYWRPVGPVRATTGPAPVELEVLLAHPSGIVEVFLGAATGPRIELATDVVARTATAHQYTAASRLYGLVEGDLLWALDTAADGGPMRSYASARLRRVG